MSSSKRILFLNPPGKKIYIRDYYCSKVSKAYYLPQPVDLLMQSAFFNEPDYKILVMDCIAEKISETNAYKKIKCFKPNYIIGQIGAVSLIEDQLFYNIVKKENPNTIIACSGDALLEKYGEKFQKYKWLDAIITNFFKNGFRQLIEGGEKIEGLVYRQEGEFVVKDSKRSKPMDMAVPKQHFFMGNYRMPFANAFPMATVLTNYACPYPCTFCIMSTLPYTTRTAASIITELKELKAKGYKFIYFSDQTFFQSKTITREVLEWMIEDNYGINWMCFSRVDVLNEKELRLMKAAGCTLIMFGVEWAEDDLLTHYKKHYTTQQIEKTFALSKKIGIKRLGTFLIGVPGQSKASILNTIAFAKKIDADYASFNVAVPRSNTSFRTEALKEGLIDDSLEVMDQSGNEVTIGTGLLSRKELQQLKNKAYRSFYFRPKYILKRLLSLRNWTELKIHFKEGWYILKSLLN
ncbi:MULTISPECIES: B12-binding domain-containing radical SAM protein [Aquimarina]|uniref:Radical SAM protein n=1 Tax=Aquimarina algiphila TaxID=2047982 RepID=A0A554VEM6_9FLAO|nr:MULTISPECIES: radical SAM protein [Aquimarina]TSE05538.1 radical SAM protein [Aquimarina algiphila]